jgi:methionine synthase II (cobalamin-independent)
MQSKNLEEKKEAKWESNIGMGKWDTKNGCEGEAEKNKNRMMKCVKRLGDDVTVYVSTERR